MVKLFFIAALCVFLLLELHHSLTHDCMGRKITPPAKPVYKKTDMGDGTVLHYTPPSSYDPMPPNRFVFDEDFFFDKMIKIAKRFDLKLSYTVSDSWDNDEVLWYKAALAGKYCFELSFSDDMISITPVGLNVHNYYKFSYNFELLDDNLSDKKARKYIRADRDFENTSFASSIMFDNLSDDEIFDIIEKIIEALYGATSMTYETAEAEDGKESFTFYLDAPDYYGYSETAEIGNFKFILNKENGGDKNV